LLVAFAVPIALGTLLIVRVVSRSADERALEPATLEHGVVESSTAAAEFAAQRSAVVAQSPDAAVDPATPSASVPAEPAKEDYSDLAGIQYETNPRVAQARILRHQLRVYEAKPKHETFRGDEWALMLTSIAAILDADPAPRVTSERVSTPAVWSVEISGHNYTFEHGRFPEYDAIWQRQEDLRSDPKLYETPLDPSVFRALEEHARKALVLLESGG
jgi:hypothetical protein